MLPRFVCYSYYFDFPHIYYYYDKKNKSTLLTPSMMEKVRKNMRFKEVREIKNTEKKVIPSQYLINELNKYFDEIDSEDTTGVVMSKLDMIKSTSPEQLEEITRINLGK